MFAVGREVSIGELSSVLELAPGNVQELVESMRTEFEEAGRGVQIIKVNDGYQLCSRKENYEYIYQINGAFSSNWSADTVEIFKRTMILEGDWMTNTPTEEEVKNHGGKYRANIQVNGKNKLDITRIIEGCSSTIGNNSPLINYTKGKVNICCFCSS